MTQPAQPAAPPPAAGVPLQYIIYTSEVTPASAKALLTACAGCVAQNTQSVYLLISTPGGDVREGMALYNALRGMPFDLTTHNIANVDSIGNVIFLAGEHRYACPSATFMFHGVGFNVEKVRLERKNLQEMMDGVDADTTRMSAIIAGRGAFPTPAEVNDLFLQASTKDAIYAQQHGLIHNIRDVQIPPNTPVFQVPA